MFVWMSLKSTAMTIHGDGIQETILFVPKDGHATPSVRSPMFLNPNESTI